MSDTCNAARCTKRLLGDAIMKTMQEKIGAEAWEAMSVEERNSKFRFYRADCWQHLRNIIIEAMSQAGTACLKDTLSESLEQFCGAFSGSLVARADHDRVGGGADVFRRRERDRRAGDFCGAFS